MRRKAPLFVLANRLQPSIKPQISDSLLKPVEISHSGLECGPVSFDTFRAVQRKKNVSHTETPKENSETHPLISSEPSACESLFLSLQQCLAGGGKICFSIGILSCGPI